MFRIKSSISTRSQEFLERYNHNKKLLEKLEEALKEVEKGGPKEAYEKLKKRNKLPVRERIKLLIDKDSKFYEIMPLAAYNMYNNEVPAAGLITGIGYVHKREVMIIANDPTVKGGTYFPETVKKHIRAQEIALKAHIPVIYLVDSGGIFLPLQSQTFPDKEHFGRFFYNQARMSAMGIPQISVVFGYCTAGGAYIPAMSDEVVIVRKQGTIFIGGPPLVKAATGEDVSPEELGGAELHTRVSGVADHLAVDEKHAIQIARNIIYNLNFKPKYPIERRTPEEPYYDPEEILGILPKDLREPFDIREVIARLVDGSFFHEFKREYATTLVTGFAYIMGYPVAIVANNGVLFPESALKGSHFIQMASIRKIPLLFLQNVTGFVVGKEYEAAGLAKAGAKMVHAVAVAEVPKITVIIGNSYGAGNYAMAGRAYDPLFLFTWPSSRIGVMGPDQAITVLKIVRKNLPKEEEEKIRNQYLTESNPYYATARIWDDGIISPLKTREYIGMALSVALNAPIFKTQFGVFRF